MPELPEVETIRRVLARKLTGRRILDADLRAPKLAATRLNRSLAAQAHSLEARLQGRRITGVRRRAKYLLVDLDRGVLLVHLGMTGQLFAARAGERPAAGLPALPDKHTHLILDLTGGWRLYYRDIRKFGRLHWLEDRAEEARVLGALGPEPLGAEFTPAILSGGLKGRTASIKALLLNQRLVAGLGNIYADEALFRAGIAPRTRGGRLGPARILRLHAAVREVLTEAIRHRGTTMSDYFDPESRKGGFQDRLRAYGRTGEPCPTCGAPIARAVVAQRGTHWCPKCQRG
jgi:formamidopyrimidine-DNA glycosylase